MIAAIAHMGGHDPKDDRVKTLVCASLCGNAAKDFIKEVEIRVDQAEASGCLQSSVRPVPSTLQRPFRL
jgi:hypothetical protein